MLSRLTADSVVLHETATRAVHAVEGLVGVPAPRRSVRTRPQAHGTIDDTRYLDEALITINGHVWGVDQSAAFAEFRAVTAPFVATLLDNTTTAVLAWTEGESGLSLQRVVKLAGAIQPPLSEGAALLSYSAIVASADPRAYSQVLTTAVGSSLTANDGGDTFPDAFPDTFAPSSAGTTVFTNNGNAPTQPVLRIYGYAAAPAVVLGARRIALAGTLAPGDRLDIDLQARTLTLWSGGLSSNAAALLDPAGTSWFSLPAGAASSVALLAGSFDASTRLDIIGRSAYL